MNAPGPHGKSQAGADGFDIFDFLAILQENQVIEPTNASSIHCQACNQMHFRQWFRAAAGAARFYVCAVAGRAMFQGNTGHWQRVNVRDLVRWLLSPRAAVRAA